MPKTQRKVKPFNTTPQQARFLLRERKLLVVDACKFQPVNFEKYSAVAYEQEFPYQPGDVVPFRERWRVFGDDYPIDNGDTSFASCAGPQDCMFEASATSDELMTFQFRPARTQPEWAIRLHPVVESVECRRINSITPEEAIACGWRDTRPNDPMWDMVPMQDFIDDWHRRYRLRGAEFGFDRAWAWFTTFVLKGE